MSPSAQHLIVICPFIGPVSWRDIVVEGLNPQQLAMLTNGYSKKSNFVITDMLNYLANTHGFEVFSAMANEGRHFFYLKNK